MEDLKTGCGHQALKNKHRDQAETKRAEPQSHPCHRSKRFLVG